MIITSKYMRAAVLSAALSVSIWAAAPAVAGCLSEFDDCGDCAQGKLWRAFKTADPFLAAEAYVDGLDCEIDLLHCIVYAHHHSYSCSA